MTGGLLQLSTSGSSDLFLVGSPEITMFKIVYRRCTNFAMESIEFGFDDEVGFGTTSSIIIPKTGDLIHNIYVKITIPQMNLTRTPPGTNLTSQLQTAQAQYQYVINFMQVNIEAYRNGVDEYNSVNTTPQDMINAIDQTFNIDNFSGAIKIPFQQALYDTGFVYSQISIEDIADGFTDNNGIVLPGVTKLQIYNAIQLGLQNSIVVQNYFYSQITSLQAQINEANNTQAKFAWVKRLGHVIMNTMQITIGGDIIDKHYGDWLNIWYELSSDFYLDDVYNKMIGNVPELTTVDRTVKQQYTMYVPLQFWFCRNNGLALPLIALEYHDVELKIVFNNIEDCGYIGELTSAQLANPTTKAALIKQYNITSLIDYVENTGLDLSASLYIDYIYLDSNERKKFAQVSHEYLIEQLQVINFTDISGTMYQDVIDFYHPCKEIIWVAQSTTAGDNSDGYEPIDVISYTVNTGTNDVPNYIVPITYTSIDFNSMNRIMLFESTYYNFIQPYECHTRAPNLGVNVYSFALRPEEHQPSGQCNLTVIDQVLFKFIFDPLIMQNGISLNINMYATNYNVLRFHSGMCALAFVR